MSSVSTKQTTITYCGRSQEKSLPTCSQGLFVPRRCYGHTRIQSTVRRHNAVFIYCRPTCAQTNNDHTDFGTVTMVRGWLRPQRGPPGLPSSTQNAQRGEYDKWEPLGRLLLPDLHAKVDDMLTARKAAKKPFAPSPTAPPPAESEHAEQEPAASQAAGAGLPADSPSIARRGDQGAQHTDGGETASRQANTDAATNNDGPSISLPLAAVRSTHGQDNDEAPGNGPPLANAPTTIASADASAASQPNHNQSQRHEAPLPQSGREHTNDPAASQTIAAYFADPLPLYTRHPVPDWSSPPTYTPQPPEEFCANCDPRTQTSLASLLSDYLCSECWTAFVLWRSNQTNSDLVYPASPGG